MEDFSGMDMDALESFDPSSDRTGSRVHPGGWGSLDDAGPMKGDFFGLDVESRPLKGEPVSGAELESLLSLAFGEHASEIARRVGSGSGTPSGLIGPPPGGHIQGPIGSGAAPQPAPPLPQRSRSTREQLAMLLSVAFGDEAERIMDAVQAQTAAQAPADTAIEDTQSTAARQAIRREAMARLVAMTLGDNVAAPKMTAPQAAAPKMAAPQAAAPKMAAPQAAAPKMAVPKPTSTAAISKAATPQSTQEAGREAAVRKLVAAARTPAEAPDRNAAALKAIIDAARNPGELPAARAAAVVTVKPAAQTVPAPAPQATPRVAIPKISTPAPQVTPAAVPQVAPQDSLAAQVAATVSAVRSKEAASQVVPVSAPAADPAPQVQQCASTPARKSGGPGRPHVPSGRSGGGGQDGAPKAKKAAAVPAAKASPIPVPEPRPANDPAVPDASSGLGWGLFMFAVFGATLYGWTQRETGYLSAETGTGYYLGIAGAVMMALLLLYPMRKKMNFMRRMGPVKYWFQTHMIMGVVGPLLVVFHSNFALGSLNSQIALFTMLVVAFSGLFGRFMYTKIHHGLYGRRATAAEMRMGLKSAHGTLEGDIEFPEEMNERLLRLEKWLNAPTGVIGRTWRLLTVRPRTIWTRLRIRRVARVALKQRAEQDGWDRKTLSRHRKALRKHFKEYYRSVHSVAEFGFYERIFGLWHLLHFPLFLMMVFTALIHVLAVHMY
ncbi:MAG: hypothetical protein OEY97_04290 [Nitrospirota bacterium]|nr:hypothetical protein [Nitrospirota bacterium]